MKLWQNIRAKLSNANKNNKVTATKVINLLNSGYSPMGISSQIYDIPEIRTAINFIAEKVACVPISHVKEDSEGNIIKVRDRIDFVLRTRMNPKQSPQVFWTQAITVLLLYNNCFILPEWNDKGTLQWLYILPFNTWEFGVIDGKTTITFSAEYTFFYEDIIHLQRFPTQKGGTTKQATSNYIQIINTLENQAVKDSETSGRLSALLQVKTNLKGSDMLKKLNEFKDLFLTAENTTGFGMIGADYDVHQLNLNVNPLNKELLDTIVRALYNYFGSSLEIINGSASELSYEQFVDNTIKPLVYQIEEELSYKLFSEMELYYNNRISAETIDLEISTLSAKTVFFDKMLYQGVLSRNEVRKRLGMGRVEGLDEYRANLNSVAINKINDYQGVGGGGSSGDTENTYEEQGTEASS